MGPTSFELDRERMGYLLAHYLVGDLEAPRTNLGFLDIGGRLIRRDSA